MPYDEEDSNKLSSRERRRQRKNKYESEEEVSEIDSEKEERKSRRHRRKIEEEKELSPSPERSEDRNRREKRKKRERTQSERNSDDKKKTYDNDAYENTEKEKSRRKRKRKKEDEKVSTIELKHIGDHNIRFDNLKQELNGDINGYIRSFFEPEYGEDVANRINYIRRRVSTTHQCYKFFLKFCRIIQGLLAGICLWEIVIVYGGGLPDYQSFIVFYSPLSVPFQAIYCVFAAVSLVFIGDRLVCRFMTKTDVEPLPLVWRIFSWTTLAGLIYFIGFILSLVQAPTDMSIHLAIENVTHWLEYADNTQILRAWQIGTLFRCLCGIIGFMAVTFEPSITFS